MLSVDFPNATTISPYAFSNCGSLKQVTFPNVTTIGNYAFQNCLSLNSISIPIINYIGHYAFFFCGSMKSITIGTHLQISTEISNETNVFLSLKTENIDLFLGDNILPLPDLENNTWFI